MRLGPGLLYEGRTLQGARPKLADFCSATMAEFYSAVDIIEVPRTESQRVGLETHVSKCVMLDEINTDILEGPYVWEDRTPIGTFSSVFTSKIQSSLIALARSGGASIVDRLK